MEAREGFQRGACLSLAVGLQLNTQERCTRKREETSDGHPGQRGQAGSGKCLLGAWRRLWVSV